MSDIIADGRDSKHRKESHIDGTFILDNTDPKKNVEVGDTLAREFGNGSRDLKVVSAPRFIENIKMSDESQEPVYIIHVRRRRLDLGE